MIDDSSARRRRRWAGRSYGILLIALVCGTWGWLLPRLADLPWAERHRLRLSSAQIDASALFYTELEPWDRWLMPVRAARQRNPRVWWQPTWPGTPRNTVPQPLDSPRPDPAN